MTYLSLRLSCVNYIVYLSVELINKKESQLLKNTHTNPYWKTFTYFSNYRSWLQNGVQYPAFTVYDDGQNSICNLMFIDNISGIKLYNK